MGQDIMAFHSPQNMSLLRLPRHQAQVAITPTKVKRSGAASALVAMPCSRKSATGKRRERTRAASDALGRHPAADARAMKP
jgi:hypothetical protein